ncbi:CopD family protein, partial [Promicromonospora thailandica]
GAAEAALRDTVADRPRARLRRVARVAAGVAALGWWAAVPVVALYQLGVPVSAIADAGTWSALAPAEYAVPAAVTLGLAVAAGGLPAVAPDRTRTLLVLAGCLLALAAPAFTGHTRAASPEALVVGVDVLHLVAGAVWLGGLVAVVLVLGDLVHDDAGALVLGRFSAVAAGVLAVLVVAGVVLAWRVAGSWAALVGSGYGVLLLVKVLVALVAVGLAAWNRYGLLTRLRAARRPRERTAPARLVVRTALAEAAVLVAVLGVTGFLVDRSPEEDRTVAGQPSAAAVTEAVRLDGVTAAVSLDPPAVGPATVTVTMTDAAGEPFEGYAAPEVGLTSGDVDLGLVPLGSRAPGVYAGEVVLPTTGDWAARVSLRTTEFDNPVQTVTFRVP